MPVARNTTGSNGSETERIERQARANRRLRVQLAALAVALVVALVVGFVAVDQRQRANEEALVAEARELAAAAEANLNVDPERSVLLALEAVELSRSDDGSALPEAEEALHHAVTASRIVLNVPGVGGSLDWSPDGSIFVTEGPEETGLVDIRDAQTGKSVRSFHGTRASMSTTSPSVVTARCSPPPETTAPPGSGTRSQARSSGASKTRRTSRVWGPTFSPDGSFLAASWPRRGEDLRPRHPEDDPRDRRRPFPAPHIIQPRRREDRDLKPRGLKAVVVDVSSGEELFTPRGPQTHPQGCRLEPRRPVDRHIKQRWQRPPLGGRDRNLSIRAPRPRRHDPRPRVEPRLHPPGHRQRSTEPPRFG